MQAIQRSIAGDYAAEVLFFFFKVGDSFLEPTLRMYIYDAVCLNHYPSYDVCSHLHRYPDRELIVQNSASRYMMYYKLLLNFPAMIMVLFCGAWSDVAGRKLPVMLTCIGTFLSVMIYIMTDRLFGIAPYMPLILIGAAVRGTFGRSAVMTMAAHSYVSDYSAAEDRTARLSGLVATSHFGYLFGSIAAGVCLESFGFTTVFLSVIAIQLIIMAIALVCMRDEKVSGGNLLEEENLDTVVPDIILDGNHSEDDPCKPLLEHSWKSDQGSTPVVLIPELLVEAKLKSKRAAHCDEERSSTESRISSSGRESMPSSTIQSEASTEDEVHHDVTTPLVASDDVTSDEEKPVGCFRQLIDSFSVCTHPRKGASRYTLCILFFIVYLQQANKSGETDVLLLFSKRSPINLGKAGYGYLLAVVYASLGFFAFVVPRVMGWTNVSIKDTTLSLVGSSFKVASLALVAVSNTQWMLFLACVVGGPQSLTISSAKSMVSKLCQEKDLGKAFSLLSSGETLANLIGTVFYTNLYSLTLELFPGLTFIVEMSLYILVFLLFLQMSISCRDGTDPLLRSPEVGSRSVYGSITATATHQRRVSAYVSP